jgi:hypothetical protein
MIRLTRSVVVSSFDAAATVAVGRDRPEFLAVGRLAADLDRPISARDVLRELLGPRPEVLGWRVIERCVGLGLLERSGQRGDATLSGAGRLALEHGEVLVPEEGVWRFFMIDDPLVPWALIHAQRLETEPVRKERVTAKTRTRGERQPEADHPSELLRRCKGGAPHESLQNGHLFQLCELAERGAAGPSGKLRLGLTWGAEPSIRLSGRLPSGDDGAKADPIDAGIPVPEVVTRLKREGLWQALVTHATQVPGPVLERWKATTGEHVVPVALSSLPAVARHRFRHDLDVPASDLMGLGRFEPAVLKEVHLVPASDTDAQAWLAWLQWEAVNDYVTPALLEQQGGEQRARFTHHRPRTLSAPELLARARADRDERSWFLLGPSDLGLWS